MYERRLYYETINCYAVDIRNADELYEHERICGGE